jgi:WNK lysine deficient protein kinase
MKYPRLKVIKVWCKEILQGIKYLHQQIPPIIHRDIKCDNIFIDKNNGKLTIGDLGYACMLKNEFVSSFSGTPEFMAPEVFDSKYCTKADIYSFGMCVLEMVTLEKPYRECENIMKIYNNAKDGIVPKALNRIKNDYVKSFILKCLSKENERPSAIELLESE